jgi:hypothetical protein
MTYQLVAKQSSDLTSIMLTLFPELKLEGP